MLLNSVQLKQDSGDPTRAAFNVVRTNTIQNRY